MAAHWAACASNPEVPGQPGGDAVAPCEADAPPGGCPTAGLSRRRALPTLAGYQRDCAHTGSRQSINKRLLDKFASPTKEIKDYYMYIGGH